MTCSAPSERTMSTLSVLHTPVTSAPEDLAICTANVPTPPDAPMINTCCPGRTRPPSRTACRAVRAEMVTGAAGDFPASHAACRWRAPEPQEPDRVRQAGHDVAGAAIQPGRTYAQQHPA